MSERNEGRDTISAGSSVILFALKFNSIRLWNFLISEGHEVSMQSAITISSREDNSKQAAGNVRRWLRDRSRMRTFGSRLCTGPPTVG